MAMTTTLAAGTSAAETADYKIIKQGDAVMLPVTIYLNGEAITESTLLLIDKVEFMLGNCVRKVLDASDAWNTTLGQFLCPLDQADTLRLCPGFYDMDCRVQFYGGGVLGARSKERVKLIDANSRRVIQ